MGKNLKNPKKTSFLFVQFLISIFRFIESYFLGVIQKVCLLRRGGGGGAGGGGLIEK